LLNVLRITQEAFANVFKHGAHKGNVELFLGFRGDAQDRLALTISSEMSANSPPAAVGNGLRNMRERASSIGGNLSSGPNGSSWVVDLDFLLPA
jgi:signal transduction histidine kinase